MKRKRSRHPEPPRKKPKTVMSESQSCSVTSSRVNHPVLRCYYKEVVTLRTYLCKLNHRISHRRRDTILKAAGSDKSENELSKLLDSTLVAFNFLSNHTHSQDDRSHDLALFSQQQPQSTLGHGSACDSSLLLEVIDFVVWLLFRRCKTSGRPSHLLCQGFERASGAGKSLSMVAASSIPGIVCQFPNQTIEEVTSPVWCQLLSLLGRGGDFVMVDLLVDCALFIPASGQDGLQQLSGFPISQLSALKVTNTGTTADLELKDKQLRPPSNGTIKRSRDWSSIRFVRSRMFYARPALNTNRVVRLGLRHIHVLNRFLDIESDEHTIHVMKYIFPRQFGLHNVFTSDVDSRETAQAFKDYTLREQEISYARRQAEAAIPTHLKGRLKPHLKLPKRLRGCVVDLVRDLRINHQKCRYVELLRHHCRTQVPDQTKGKVDPTAHATPHANVSAFCRTVFERVFPTEFWGLGLDGETNMRTVSRNIDEFIRLRKGESLTLHDVLQDVQIGGIVWLRPAKSSGKMSQSDFEKRKEMLAELVYYVFDSFIIPLIRSNFHVTESNVHRNRLFYFRHDIWRRLTEPTIAELKSTMFEEMKPVEARKVLSERAFGYSTIRLLPKATGFRPIANLRRRMLTWRNGKKVLGRSINSLLTPTFKVLDYEKVRTLHNSLLQSHAALTPPRRSTQRTSAHHSSLRQTRTRACGPSRRASASRAPAGRCSSRRSTCRRVSTRCRRPSCWTWWPRCWRPRPTRWSSTRW